MSRLKWLLLAPVVLVVLAVGGTWLYINVIRDDPPEELSIDDLAADPSTDDSTGGSAGSAGSVDGEWTIGGGSIAGYRADEVRLGQSLEAVGRTEVVTGTMTISGTTVEEASFEVDLTTLESDESLRDGQVQGRILETEQFPTATFELTEPLDLGELPATGETVSVEAAGDLTIHGETQSVTFTIEAQLDGDSIAADGLVPLTWADYGIDDPSGGPNQVEPEGEMEFLLIFEPA
jgi:polyisoprenoid-binding protein YceI